MQNTLHLQVGKKVSIRSLRIDRNVRSRNKTNRRRDRTLARLNTATAAQQEKNVFEDGKVRDVAMEKIYKHKPRIDLQASTQQLDCECAQDLYADYRGAKHLFTGTGHHDYDVALLQHTVSSPFDTQPSHKVAITNYSREHRTSGARRANGHRLTKSWRIAQYFRMSTNELILPFRNFR